MILAFIAGILLLIEGISGVVTWEIIREFVLNYITDNELVEIIFAILLFIASLGGISVMIGGYLIGKNNVKTGKFFIMLGAGIGLIGLLISIIIGIIQESITFGVFFTIGATGLILSIIARMIAK